MRTAGSRRAARTFALPLLVLLPVLADRHRVPAGGPPRRHVVDIRGMAFQPAALEVAAGDTVVWVNRDIVPHTATAAGRNGWDTGPIGQGESRIHVPQRAGTSTYVCSLHPTMLGRLVVR